MRGDQHLSARKPVSRVGNKIANRPVPIVEVEFFDPSYFPVEAVQPVTRYGFDFVQHRCPPFVEVAPLNWTGWRQE